MKMLPATAELLKMDRANLWFLLILFGLVIANT